MALATLTNQTIRRGERRIIVFKIVVDYTKSLIQTIRNGKHNYIDSGINQERFTVQGTRKQELTPQLLHYDESMSPKEILEDMEARGLRPATVRELRTYGKKFPKKLGSATIATLSSLWRSEFNFRCTLFTYNYESKRVQHFDWHGMWHDIYQYLAFCK
jgi:hypothetical protein